MSTTMETSVVSHHVPHPPTSRSAAHRFRGASKKISSGSFRPMSMPNVRRDTDTSALRSRRGSASDLSLDLSSILALDQFHHYPTGAPQCLPLDVPTRPNSPTDGAAYRLNAMQMPPPLPTEAPWQLQCRPTSLDGASTCDGLTPSPFRSLSSPLRSLYATTTSVPSLHSRNAERAVGACRPAASPSAFFVDCSMAFPQEPREPQGRLAPLPLTRGSLTSIRTPSMVSVITNGASDNDSADAAPLSDPLHRSSALVSVVRPPSTASDPSYKREYLRIVDKGNQRVRLVRRPLIAFQQSRACSWVTESAAHSEDEVSAATVGVRTPEPPCKKRASKSEESPLVSAYRTRCASRSHNSFLFAVAAPVSADSSH
ncbi:hypothetical protein NESM_000228200 [Novymonas esmeraldas]|uniref:Uncharacterized protein n=1 Tax=Novymonas esmeraldas TaxID=1808958 RepID=A0AAW0F9C3_9TRYP